MPKKINKELSRHPGGRRPLLGLETTLDFFRHPELQLLLYASWDERYKGGCPRVVSGSINVGHIEHMEKITEQSQEVSAQNSKSKSGLRPQLIDSGSESGMTLSVSQGNNEVFCHPERSEGSQKHSLSRRERPLSGEGRGEGAALKNSEVDALPKNETNLFTYSLITLFTSTKAAFTLAEVLITLAIIGVVAALTIPGLIENHNQKALDTAKSVFIRRLQEATKQMNVDGKMQGYSTTEDFVKTFRNYMKNMQVCEKGKTEKCFAAQIKIPTGEKIEEFDTSELQTSKNFKKDYNTNIMGYSLPNGASMLLAYDPDCSNIDPFDSNADTTKCISMVYDVNGKKKPNEQGKDIFTLNGVQLSVPCKKKHEALNMTLACEDIEPEPLNTCIGNGNEIYDDRGNHRYCEYNRWAGAKKACEVQGMRLPSLQELADIATYLYDQDDDPIGPYEYRKASLNYEKLNELNFGTVDFYVSNEPYVEDNVSVRSFSSDETGKWGMVASSLCKARCVK